MIIIKIADVKEALSDNNRIQLALSRFTPIPTCRSIEAHRTSASERQVTIYIDQLEFMQTCRNFKVKHRRGLSN